MARVLREYQQDEDDDLDYSIDWSATMTSDGDTISLSTWTVNPTGPTLDNQSSTTTATTTYVSGGTVGTDYTVTNQITTAGGRVYNRSFIVRVRRL